MANIELSWIKTESPVKLGEFAKHYGVDISRLADHDVDPFQKFPWLEAKVRRRILEEIEGTWEENKHDKMSEFAKIRKGVYVITLASNIAIDYGGQHSQVLYIGRGTIKQRFSEHLKRWIPAIANSIYDFGLHFWMTEVKKPGNAEAFKEVESDLIGAFREEYKTLPLQNSKNGDRHEKYHSYENGWKRPFYKGPGLKHGWAIRPLDNNPWAMTFDEE